MIVESLLVGVWGGLIISRCSREGGRAPEALAGGPLGRLRDGDPVRVEVDTRDGLNSKQV